ncbi:MAG: M23 family metallopeptidase [Thermaerobacter sp.]|nr:M23 family metallopeptidase [Thermaerobacter sp.]
MGKLALRIAAAVLLAGGLFWATRASGVAAASVRRILHTYIAANTLSSVAPPRAVGQANTSAAQRGLSWPLTGAISEAAQDGINIAAPSGTLVRSASAGRVASLDADAPGVDIVVSQGSLTLTYGHVGPTYVHKGQVVRVGEVLGEIPHFGPGLTSGLLFQARVKGKATSALALLGSP